MRNRFLSSSRRPCNDPMFDGAATVADVSLSESTVEAIALDWLVSLGWTVLPGPDIAPETPGAERTDYGEVVLQGRASSKTPLGD